MQTDQVRLVEHNTAILSNLLNVVSLSLNQVLGKQVQRTLDEETVSDDAVNALVAARLKNKLAL